MTSSDKMALLMAAVILTVMALGLWYKSGVEADTYNRLTGGDLTQWEALWVNTRIDCNR